MLFCSYEFVVVFLPVVLIVVLGASALGHRAIAKVALLVASLGFYAWWNPRYLPLLFALLGFNYLVGNSLIKSRDLESQRTKRLVLVAGGICANVLALVYFKYSDFCLTLVGTLSGRHFEPLQIVLPLGISFIVFQKIAFLVDAYSGQITKLSALDYGLFVSFFPQLIAGPIVHHREVMPQFESERTLQFNSRCMALAVSFFVLGLAKKILLADSLSEFVALGFKQSDLHGDLGAFDAWSGVLAYTLQIYFDFSGYSDMAIGLGLMFGIRLPFNFNSPLKAASIIEFWNRWHMTLTRFLTAYVYNPLALRATRRWVRAGRKPSTRGRMTAGAFTWLLAVPTLLTMLIAGAWHGAGYQFIVFGLIHGVYLVVNHAWRALTKVRRTQRREVNGSVWGTAFARSLTLIAVLISMAFFRSPSLSSAFRYVGALSGMNGFFGTVTAWNFNALNGFSHLGLREKFSILDDTKIIFVLPALFLISQLLPNTQQILREPLETAVGPLVKHAGETSGMDLTKASSYSWPSLNWRPSVPWAVALGLLAWLSVTHLVAPGEFLYFRF